MRVDMTRAARPGGSLVQTTRGAGTALKQPMCSVDLSRCGSVDAEPATPPLHPSRELRTVVATITELCFASAGCYAFDWAFHNPYCGVLFRCHCTFPWAGGSAGCNVHHTTGPQCPWCNVLHTHLRGLAPLISSRFTRFMMLGAYVGTWVLQSHPPRDWKVPPLPTLLASRAMAAVSAFVVLGFALALTFFALTDYPCFLWIVDDGPNGTACGWRHNGSVVPVPNASQLW